MFRRTLRTFGTGIIVLLTLVLAACGARSTPTPVIIVVTATPTPQPPNAATGVPVVLSPATVPTATPPTFEATPAPSPKAPSPPARAKAGDILTWGPYRMVVLGWREGTAPISGVTDVLVDLLVYNPGDFVLDFRPLGFRLIDRKTMVQDGGTSEATNYIAAYGNFVPPRGWLRGDVSFPVYGLRGELAYGPGMVLEIPPYDVGSDKPSIFVSLPDEPGSLAVPTAFPQDEVPAQPMGAAVEVRGLAVTANKAEWRPEAPWLPEVYKDLRTPLAVHITVTNRNSQGDIFLSTNLFSLRDTFGRVYAPVNIWNWQSEDEILDGPLPPGFSRQGWLYFAPLKEAASQNTLFLDIFREELRGFSKVVHHARIALTPTTGE